MKRPVQVQQRENEHGDFWYTVQGGNGENTATSKMYATRARAKRAARAMIKALDPAPIRFVFWQGPTRQTIAECQIAGRPIPGIRNRRVAVEYIR